MQGPVSQLALIAFGSNENSILGDATETIQKATKLVAQLSDQPPRFSRLYNTPAFPTGAGPDFVNAAAAIFTKLSAGDLLAALHRIEAKAGRTRTRRWGQRTLDLDLIALGDEVAPDEATQTYWRDLPPERQQEVAPRELILPHPRLQDRAFVLVPLLDVAPDWVHPLLGQSLAQLCAGLPQSARAEVVAQRVAQSP